MSGADAAADRDRKAGDTATALDRALRENGYSFLSADDMRVLLDPAALDRWDGFAESWNHLGVDRYMADGGRYRRRRHAVFVTTDRPDGSGFERKAHQPHYQSRDFNELNGGIERWFTPVDDAVANHPVLLSILSRARATFDALTPPGARPENWHVELHQFRIEPTAGEDGQPTPEGLHRDGVDWVLVLLVRRENVESGDTSIHDAQRRPLGTFTLREPLDATFVDDSRVYHGVTAIRPIDQSRPAYRDVLVVTFRRQ
ncbi:MAG: 2OG-Fe dioxygenase family protein [Gluconacetobacter diazotrophicus]|nr:2OG-Fe dioxygenase family protein [Gluconacetobacter diazotrophicus]